MKQIALILPVLLCTLNRSLAVGLDQIDTFSSALLENWNGASPDIAFGGLGGTNDPYLILNSTGSGASGGKMVAHNNSQWAGNYQAAGIGRVAFKAINLGSKSLSLRAVLKTGFGRTAGYCSTTPFLLSPDGMWHRGVFQLSEPAMTLVNSTSLTFNSLFASVGELRFLHSSAPGVIGDPIEATLGLDNIQMLPTANPALSASVVSNQISISWQRIGFTGFQVESSSLPGEQASWIPVTNLPVIIGNSNVVQLPLASFQQRFFRLVLP